MENHKRTTGDAVVQWLLAIDDPECYVRPIDVAIAAVLTLLDLACTLVSTTPLYKEWLYNAFCLDLIGFTVYLSIRWYMRMRQ